MKQSNTPVCKTGIRGCESHRRLNGPHAACQNPARVAKLVIRRRLKISRSQERVGSTPTPGTMQDELLDIVDEKDNVIGTRTRAEVYADHLLNCRVVNAFIVNSRGELWIPRRLHTKKNFPSCLDMSMGGHVESGETYEHAFAREMKEELNIDVTQVPYREIGYLVPKDLNLAVAMKAYELAMDIAPRYNPEDFSEYFWLTPEAYFERLAKGEKVKPHLTALIQKFYKK